MEIKQRYRRMLIGVLIISILFTIGYTWFYVRNVIPDEIYLVREQESSMGFQVPLGLCLESESEEVTVGQTSNILPGEVDVIPENSMEICGSADGTYQLSLKLFGYFQLKNISVNVGEERRVIPCGTPVGVYLQTDGIMVVGTGKLKDQQGGTVEPAYGILKSGDYILEINGQKPETKEALSQMIAENGSAPLIFQIRREEEILEVKVEPALTESGDYKAGIWVRDDTHGIGTLTYIDDNGNFGALGHGISDADTGRIVEAGGGSLYEANIFSIQKGSLGSPGSLGGSILYRSSSFLGEIIKNTSCGVYGTANQILKDQNVAEAVPVAYSQDIHTGLASIRCCLDGQMKEYGIEILKVGSPNKESKSMVIQVIDEELLSLTGGICQGMSGSPIIQDGKLVGAVTHVFVQDPTKGYGIFIENMLEQ